MLSAALFRHGTGVHIERARQARDLAAYTVEALRDVGWPAQRLPHAFTVTLAQPGPLPRPWVLGGDERVRRIICMPGVERAWIDELVADIAPHRRRVVVP